MPTASASNWGRADLRLGYTTGKTTVFGKYIYHDGDNTDGVGLVRDLTHNHGFDLKGSSLLLLGAGGAARGVILPLLREQPEELLIANRTAEKAVMRSTPVNAMARYMTMKLAT